MIVLVAAIFLLMSSFQKGNCEEMCQTKSCLETAVRVMNSMNETVNPCDDFFEFACGGWIKKNPIPRHEVSWNVMKIIEEKIDLRVYEILKTPNQKEDGRPIKMARALYRSCMDRKSIDNVGLKPLTDAFAKVGLPTLPPTDENAANLDIPKIVGSALRHYGIHIFVKLDINQDLNNSSIYRLVLKQLSPDYDNLDEHLRDPIRFKTEVEAQKTFVGGMMTIAGMKEKNETYATEIMSFMTEIVKIMASPKEMDNKNSTRLDVTIMELQNLTDPDVKHWNWTKYFNAVFEQTDVIVDPIKDTALINDMTRYVWWEIYSKIAPYTLQYFRDYIGQFRKLPHYFDATTFTCTEVVKKFFDMTLTAAYVEKHFNVQNKKSASEMWTDVTSSFDEMLAEYKWMDAETRAQAHRKLLDMKPLIGYPEWITDPKKMEEYYKEYEVSEESLAQTYMNLESFKRKRILNSWKQTPDRNTWLISSVHVDAQSIPQSNTIMFADGYLHEPFYGNAAQALNYGAMGTVMGHEVTHGFDKFGQKYDENRTFRNWWSEEALKYYKEQVDCVIKQYSGYRVTQLSENATLDGILTGAENVAEIGGLSIAFKAYKKQKARSQPQQAIPGVVKYTDEQLFFLGYAQMLCDSFTDADLQVAIKSDLSPPGRFRIIGTLQNNVEFAKAWNCPSGSPMNPEKKCNVW